MINKRKKNSRLRGSKTHGWGSMKKHRGAGNRGGRGLAGSGKRGDANKPSMQIAKRRFGRHGFVSKKAKSPENSVNVDYFEKNCEQLIKENLIKKEADSYQIDAEKIGITKILGSGKLTKKWIITNSNCTERAKIKIEAAGGKIIEAAVEPNKEED